MNKILILLLFCILLAGKGYSQFAADLAGYPPVTTGWIIGGNATVVDSTVQLTSSAGNESGYVFYDSVVNLTTCAQFTVDFDFKIVPSAFSTVADGIAFWYISNPPSGFILGGGIGLPSNPDGLILIQDTYDNDATPNNPLETLLYYDGTVPQYTEGSATGVLAPIVPNQSFIDDGSWHHCKLDYNAGNINVYYNYSTTPSLTGFYSISIAGYFGFSSSTGASYSTQSVKNIHITAVGVSILPTVTSPLTLCQNSVAAPLSATGTGPFHWYTTDTATVISLPGAPTPNTSVPGTTTYYVRQGVGVCISQPDSIQVIVTAQPAPPVIGGTTVYCSGDAATALTATGTTGSILWYTAATGGAGSATAITPATATAGTTTYWATQTIGGCESQRASITVTVNPTPVAPVISGTSVYCQYATYIPPTTVGTNVLWYTTSTGGGASTTPATINTALTGTYNIYASQSELGCVSPRGSLTITVNQQPPYPVITDNPDVYCPGQAFVPFTIVSGTGVLWYTTATGGAGIPTAPILGTSTPGTYTVWASQTIAGCEGDRTPVSIIVQDSLTTGFDAVVKYGCIADTIAFTNTSIGATGYSWVFGDGLSSIAKDPTHVYVLQAIDTVKMYANAGSCIDSTIKYFSLVHPLRAAFTADSVVLCQGKTVTFTNTSIGTLPTYLWNFGDGNTDTAFNTSHLYPHTGVYNSYVVVTDFIPCHDTAFLQISVDTISPIHILVTDSVLCRSTSTTLTGKYSGIGNVGIVWNFGNGDSIKNVNPVSYGFETVGTYTVTATAIYRACRDTSASRVITIVPAPSIYLGPDTTICKGSQPLTLADKINTESTGASWVWNTGETTPAITVVAPGTYSATVRIGGCEAVATVKVSDDCYINIPNVFTPNADGLNDYFFPRELLTSGLVTFKMNIYNRWGESIFESTTLDGRGWDGKFNSKDQPEGVYVYVIDVTFKDGQKEHHQGNVTLLR